MSQLHHQGEPSTGSQFAGLFAMIMLAIVTFGMFFSSVLYSSSVSGEPAARPAPTVARR
jgi:hypothetical protein